MPLIARRATLWSHIQTVLITPFVVVMAASALKWWKLVAIGLGLLLCAWFGGPIIWNDLFTPDVLIPLGGAMLLLWTLAIVLTIYDHFRYRGWEMSDDPAAHAMASDFVTALLTRQNAMAHQCCSAALRSRCSSPEFERRVQSVTQALGDVWAIMELDVPGRFRLPIFRGATTALNEVADANTNAVALVLLARTRSEESPAAIPTVRIRLAYEDGAWSVLDFDATTTALSQS